MTIVLRILGVVLFIFGIVWLYWGMDLSGSFSNRFMKEMAGDYPDETKKYIFGGIGMIVAGVCCWIISFIKRRK